MLYSENIGDKMYRNDSGLASSSDLYCQYVMVVSGPSRLPGIQMRLPQYRVICDLVELCSHLSANSRVVKFI